MSLKTPKPGAPFLRELERLAKDPPLVAAVVDIDDFAALNQENGRDAGDAVMGLIWDRFSASLPEPSILTHLGADEWMCAIGGITTEEGLLTLDGIRRDVAPLRLSIGIAGYPDHTDDPSELQRLADEALARAKRDRGNRCAIYVEEKMILKSNYYPRGQLERLAGLAERVDRTEASLLREALSDLLDRYRQSA